MSNSIFGWSLPPGCSSVPGDEPQPLCCEECSDELFEKCPGQDKCQKYNEHSGAYCGVFGVELNE